MRKQGQAAELVAGITEDEARRLDGEINEQIRGLSDEVVRRYLVIATDLNRMQETEGYRLLGFTYWEHYLDSKREYSRAYLSYLLKLGKAGDLSSYTSYQGMTGTKLITFAAATDFPEKIPQLIEATWEEVKDLKPKATKAFLNAFVSERQTEYRDTGSKRGGRPKMTERARLQKALDGLATAEEKVKLLLEVEDFLVANREALASAGAGEPKPPALFEVRIGRGEDGSIAAGELVIGRGAPRPISRSEARLLERLARHPGEEVSYDELRAAVGESLPKRQGAGRNADINDLIDKLRYKLEDLGIPRQTLYDDVFFAKRGRFRLMRPGVARLI